MSTTETLTENEWQVAHNIATKLSNDITDFNELKKMIAYLRTYANSDQAGYKFFSYLKTLVNNADKIGHSKQTKGYYISIEKACKQYLHSYQSDVSAMLQILGWASRLMRYYKQVGPMEEVAAPTVPTVEPTRQAEITKIAKFQGFKLDQMLDAKITKINGNKVTYEILETLKLTEKEPKKASSLKEGQTVQVKITALKENGSLKNVKYVDVTQTSLDTTHNSYLFRGISSITITPSIQSP
jgi:hypothetical protein